MQDRREPAVDPSSGYGVGVDIGGTKIWIVVTDLSGTIIYNEKLRTSRDMPEIARFVKQAIGQSGIDISKVRVIGFGVPGVMASDKDVILDAPALNWQNKPFIAEMQPLFDAPVFVCNDVNAAALGERWQGAAQSVDDFAFLSIGTGVGCALVAGGKLIHGNRHMAGEIAYWLSEDDVRHGRLNRTGAFGVFESKASGTSLARPGRSGEALFEQYANGEREAVAIVNEFVLSLSVGIANVVSLLNPEKVVLGGGVSQSLPVVLERIRARVAELTPIPVTIELSQLGEKAGAIGAAAYAFQHFTE